MKLQLLKDKIKKQNILFYILKSIKVYTYDVYVKYRRNKLFLSNGRKVLLDFDKAMKEVGIEYWLFFGTLLGAYREKSFIGHDFDIDVGLFQKSYTIEMESILVRNGFRKKREFLIDDGKFGREETYEKDGVSIDLFYFSRSNTTFFCHLFDNKDKQGVAINVENNGGYIVRELSYPYKGFSNLIFLGKDFMVPTNVHEILVCDYGVNYMTPDPNYIGGERKNVRYLDHKRGILKRL
ncbi:LicD family protein [Acinetobacter towneri]|uniref:LicD family protein n=1 Tax=Acinetobacter towneri TaxID=202956 RepID=UPI001AA04354|nr:LicD family protein [Acinetobacter towneri]QTD64342.1 LicD family protein [Acinetobacter towneri]